MTDRAGEASRKAVGFVPLMAALMIAEATCPLESAMIYVALSPLYEQFGDPIAVGWLLTIFTLAAASSAAIAGRLGDLFGRRRVLLTMLGIGFAGSVLSALAPTLPVMLVGRALQGASMAILPLALGMLRDHLDRKQLAMGVSILGATYAVATGLGQVVSGLIIDHFHWSGIFVLSAGSGALAFLAVFILIPKSSPTGSTGRLDWVGGLLFAPAVACVLYGLSRRSGAVDWALQGSLMAIGVLALVVWIWWELRQANPLIDLRLLKDRRLALANAIVFLSCCGPMQAPLLILPLLQQPKWTAVGFGMAATVAALFKLPANFTTAGGNLVAGYMARRTSTRLMLIIGTCACIIGWTVLAFQHDSIWLVAVLLLFFLMPGVGVIFSMAPHLILQAAPDSRISESTGVAQVMRALGHAVGIQIVAACLASQMIASPDGPGRFPAEGAYVLAFAIVAAFSVATLLAVLLLPKLTAREEIDAAPGSLAHG